MTIAAFYYWRKALGPIPTNDLASPMRHGDFAPVRLVNSTSVTVQLVGGTRLEIPMAASEAFERAIQVLVREDGQRAASEERQVGRC